MPEIPFFKFRVLIRFHPEYKVFVAHCLETGSCVTGDTDDEVFGMIKELIEDEIADALARKSLKNLLSSPSSLTVWRDWQRIQKDGYTKKERIMFTNHESGIGPIDAEIIFAIAVSHEKLPETETRVA